MFSRAATRTLTSVARRRAATTTTGVARNGSKTLRAFSEIAAEAPKDIPRPTTTTANTTVAGKHWRAEKGHRHRCHGHGGKRVAGKVLAFGLVGYGGYRYGAAQCDGGLGPRCGRRGEEKKQQQGLNVEESAVEAAAKLASSAAMSRPTASGAGVDMQQGLVEEADLEAAAKLASGVVEQRNQADSVKSPSKKHLQVEG